jgi:hypothetical protein
MCATYLIEYLLVLEQAQAHSPSTRYGCWSISIVTPVLKSLTLMVPACTMSDTPLTGAGVVGTCRQGQQQQQQNQLQGVLWHSRHIELLSK